METKGTRSARFAAVRERARRLRLPDPRSRGVAVAAGDRARFDRFDIGLVLGLLTDAAFVVAVVFSEGLPLTMMLFLGPLVMFIAMPPLALVTIAGIFLAGVNGLWRVAAGLFVCQLLAVILGFAWLLAIGGFGIPLG